MIVIIDYGTGNQGSILNMLRRLGVDAIISDMPGDIERAEKLILPGVGAFDHGMRELEARGLISTLDRQVLDRKTPILGICLGMQLFSKRSDEGTRPGLGWLNADTIHFRFDSSDGNIKIPHMGWNTIEVKRPSHLLDDRYEESRFYFVHSYHVRCRDVADVLATAWYGIEFHAAVIHGNIMGTQFHPEKSHKFGLKLMSNFARMPLE